VPIVWKSGSLNLLEPSGAVQACNGITLLVAATNLPVFIRGCVEKYFVGRSQEFQNVDNETYDFLGLIYNNKK
jgi:hypothetical protein